MNDHDVQNSKIRSMKLSESQYKMVLSYVNNDQVVKEFPKYLVIEPTNCCNLNCIMCPRKGMTRPQGYMDINLFKKIIDESEDRAEFIYLHFFGEPLLHPQITDFINYAGGKGMTIALSTNATMLKGRLADDILCSKLDLLIISLDSLDKNIFNSIRKGGDFNEILTNIENFMRKKQMLSSTLNVSLQMIEMSLNKREIENFQSRWNNLEGVSVIIKPLYNYADQVQDIRKLGNITEEPDKHPVCVEPWRGLVIGWDGTVVPCCNDFDYKFPLVHYMAETLKEIWNSEKMKAMRKCQSSGLQKLNDLCRGCLIHGEDYGTAVSHISCFNPTRKESRTYFDKGLYPDEILPDCENQWTQKNFEILVQDRFKDITIILCNDNPAKERVDVRVSLFDTPVREAAIGRRTELLLPTPEKYKGRLLRYRFSLDSEWIPKEAGINADLRKLGVRIERIINNPGEFCEENGRLLSHVK